MKAVPGTRVDSLRRLLALLPVAAMIVVSNAVPVSSSEPLPFVVSGALSAYGKPVQDHLLVVAKINGTSFSATHTRDGRFGFDPVFKVPADDPLTDAVEGGRDGDVVELYVDGRLFNQLTFESGRVSHIVTDVTTVFNRRPTIVVDTGLTGFTGLSLRLDASRSSDPDGDELTFTWDHDDGSQTCGAVSSHVFDVVGAHVTQLTVADSYGAASSTSVNITIQPIPDPLHWTKESLEGGKGHKIVDEEMGVRLWATPIDDMSLTIFEFDDAFVTDSLPTSYAHRVLLIDCDRTNMVFPLYLELEPQDGVEADASGYTFFSWREGEWRPVSCSGSIGGRQTLWAYLDEGDVGDGLLLAGLPSAGPETVVSGLTVSPQRGGVDTVFSVTVAVTSATSHVLYLRVDDELVDRAWVGDGIESVTFQVQRGVGTHEVNVNGVIGEFIVESEQKGVYMLALSLLPVSLLSLLFFRYR